MFRQYAHVKRSTLLALLVTLLVGLAAGGATAKVGVGVNGNIPTIRSEIDPRFPAPHWLSAATTAQAEDLTQNICPTGSVKITFRDSSFEGFQPAGVNAQGTALIPFIRAEAREILGQAVPRA